MQVAPLSDDGGAGPLRELANSSDKRARGPGSGRAMPISRVPSNMNSTTYATCSSARAAREAARPAACAPPAPSRGLPGRVGRRGLVVHGRGRRGSPGSTPRTARGGREEAEARRSWLPRSRRRGADDRAHRRGAVGGRRRRRRIRGRRRTGCRSGSVVRALGPAARWCTAAAVISINIVEGVESARIRADSSVRVGGPRRDREVARTAGGWIHRTKTRAG